MTAENFVYRVINLKGLNNYQVTIEKDQVKISGYLKDGYSDVWGD